MDKDVKEYAKTKTKARSHFSKFKTTGSKSAKRKADFYYSACDAMEKKFENPAPNVTVKQTTISDSFKYSKQTTNGVHSARVSVNSRSNKYYKDKKPSARMKDKKPVKIED